VKTALVTIATAQTVVVVVAAAVMIQYVRAICISRIVIVLALIGNLKNKALSPRYLICRISQLCRGIGPKPRLASLLLTIPQQNQAFHNKVS
jgi:hypothetical protein